MIGGRLFDKIDLWQNVENRANRPTLVGVSTLFNIIIGFSPVAKYYLVACAEPLPYMAACFRKYGRVRSTVRSFLTSNNSTVWFV